MSGAFCITEQDNLDCSLVVGTGTFYDLRHVTMADMPPNRARWDYHAVHIAQLLYFGTITSDSIFNSTAKRWAQYSSGIWSPHN